jgi:hypothetical protein
MPIDPKHKELIDIAIAETKIIRQMNNKICDSMQTILVELFKSENITVINEYIDAMPSGWARAKLMDRVEELENKKVVDNR